MDNRHANENQGGWDVQFVRTDGYVPGARYPVVTVITSKDELDHYCDSNIDKYDFSARPGLHKGAARGFCVAVEKYTDEFFTRRFLVLVLLEEGSGSVRHKLEMIERNGLIVISRLMPGIGTADMAEWHVIIELDISYKREQFNVAIVNKDASSQNH